MEAIGLVNTTLFLGAMLVLAGIFSSLIAARFSAPLLLVFLIVGMLLGEDGLVGLEFDDYQAAYLIGSFALAVILFDGGLRTRFSAFRGTVAPALILATLGVVVTSALIVIPAYFLFNLTPVEGLLLGAIVGSTDAAAVFFLLRAKGLQLRPKVGATLEIESGTNDPIAVFLTIMLVQLILSGQDPSTVLLLSLFQQVVVGGTFGIFGGILIMWVLNRVALPSGLHPLLVVAFAILIFASTANLGGSGFMAVYVAGLIIGNRPVRALPSIIRFHDALTWLAQIVMFIVLGLLVRPSELLLYAPLAILIALFLIFIARPAAVWMCLSPFRFERKEKVFVSWVGLRGAVSIFLAAIPMLSGLPNAELYFNVAFFVVLVSLMLQGWTINALARRLGLALSRPAALVNRIELDLPGQLDFEMVGYSIAPDSDILAHNTVPRWARPVLVIRGNEILDARDAGLFLPGDYAYFLVQPERAQKLDRLFVSSDEFALGGRTVFRKIQVAGETRLRDIAERYQLELGLYGEGMTLRDLFAEYKSKPPVPGDRIGFESTVAIVREVEDGHVTACDLLIENVVDSHDRTQIFGRTSPVLVAVKKLGDFIRQNIAIR